MPRAVTIRHDSIVKLLAKIFSGVTVKVDGVRTRPDLEIILASDSIG